MTRVGTLELRVPQDRQGRFSTEVFDRYQRSEKAEAAWLERWEARYPKLCAGVEENIDETLTFYRLPRAHHKHMKSTSMLERLNEAIKRRTWVVRIFPNAESCLRLVRVLAVEIHEDWIEGTRYLNMELLREPKRELPRQGTEAAWSPAELCFA